jgi:hypothetical protein
MVVALQTFVQGVSHSSTTALTTTTTPAPDVTVTLSSSVKTATPGEDVVLTGHLSQAVTPKQTFADLCWDGCGGLQEQGVSVRWLSSKKFQMTLLVPETAWLVARNGGVSVHPLTSGSYQVGVQCLTSISGCALRAPEAKVSIKLKAPTPQRCVRGRPCETMTLDPSTATVGDEVMVSGWAPLQDLIVQPFSYSISVTTGSGRKTYPPFAYSSAKLNGSYNVVLTPTALKVGQSPPWANLGTIPYRSSTYSGPSAIGPAGNSQLVAWCQSSGITVTNGLAEAHIPTTGVRQALHGTTLKLLPSPVVPQCTTVQLDPRFADSVYAGFAGEEGNSIPPEYLAPLYTTNSGVTWHAVPIPTGMTIEDFGGFNVDGSHVEALFNGQSGGSDSEPVGTDNGFVKAEVTSNGGISWSPTTQGCPAIGPCMTFGPYQWGYCNMSNDMQSLLLGPSGATAQSGVKWTSSTWVTAVNTCFPQQLVVSSSHDLFLLDPSSEYPLLRSTDSGRIWTNWQLPPIAAANYGQDSVPTTNSLVLAPDGSLFASITTPAGDRQEMYRLYPAATLWCQIPNAFGVTAPDLIGSLRVDATDLLWSQSSPSSMHREPFSKLTC